MISEHVWFVVFGALLGAAGQGARTILGWKKRDKKARSKSSSNRTKLQMALLVIGITSGAVVGAVAAALMFETEMVVTRQIVLGLLAAGYSGADFLEGSLQLIED